MKQKNCVFDNECPFLKLWSDRRYGCIHPLQSNNAYRVSELFKKCPLKKEKFVLELEGSE